MRPAIRIIFAPTARRARGRNCDPVRVTQGEACPRRRTVWLDPRLADVAKTYYHEKLHVRYPSWPEDRIRAKEELDWMRMTWKQKAQLYREIGRGIIEGEEC